MPAPEDNPALPPVEAAFEACCHAFKSVALFSLVINMLMLTGPLFMLQVYDRVLASQSLPTLTALFVLVTVLFCFLGLLEFIRTRLLARISDGVSNALEEPAFRATLDHAVSQTANVGLAPLRDLSDLRQFIASPGPPTLFDLPWTPLYIAVNYALHPALGHFSLAAAISMVFLSLINEWASRKPTSTLMSKAQASNIFAEEARQNAESIAAMRMGQAIAGHWQQLERRATTAGISLSNIASLFHSLSKSVRLLLQSAVLALGALLVIEGAITAGVMIAASIILARALAPIDQSISQWRQFLTARQAYKRLRDRLDGPAPLRENKTKLPAPTGRLEVKGLLVAPPGQRKPILTGIEFTLTPGKAMAILGPTGAGKSSLARTLAGIWPPLSGEVRLDGAALAHWRADQLGPAIGYLPQAVDLMTGTIKQNIARFKKSAADETIIQAAKAANVHELILKLPDGYETLIGNGGAKLSGGQKQRLGLARALYNEPRLILLDEPNANLDAAGEEALTSAIRAAKAAGQTIIIIAHRPGALMACDEVLFLEGGRQRAFGPVNETLEKILKPKGTPQLKGNKDHSRKMSSKP